MDKSTFDVTDPDNLSIRYRNLYSYNQSLHYFSVGPVELPLVDTFRYTHSWAPNVKVFDTEEELCSFVESLGIEEEEELTVYHECLWHGNIGHAFWDGFYPAYLSIVKFGYQDADFNLMCYDFNNSEGVMATSPFLKFSGGKIITRGTPQKLPPLPVKYNTVVAGVGSCGSTGMTTDYHLYGQKEYNALELFRERMLARCGVPTDLPVNEKPKAIIISNKRYSEEDTILLKELVDELAPIMDIKWVELYWDYKFDHLPLEGVATRFESQLKDYVDVDIQITGPGTGMMYTPFLKKGAVNINLGWLETCQNNSMRGNLHIESSTAEQIYVPAWMEQHVCASTKWASTLLYDRYQHPVLEKESVRNLIMKGVGMLNKPRQDVALDAKIYVEYCKRSGRGEEVARYLTWMAVFPEFLVAEHPYAVNTSIVDIPLLRRIKDEFGYNPLHNVLNQANA